LESFTKIREYLLQNTHVMRLVQLPKKVFADATVETCIFVVAKKDVSSAKNLSISIERMEVGGVISPIRSFHQSEIELGHLHNFQLYGEDGSQTILTKIRDHTRPLADFVRLVYGFKTADDQQFIHSKKLFPESKLFVRSAGIRRYWSQHPREYVWYVPEKMTANRTTARPGERARFEAEKIIVARMGKSLAATYDPGGLYVKDAMLLLSKGTPPKLGYLLGILNSRLLTYYYQRYFVTIDVLKNAVLSLPIIELDYSSPRDKARHDKMVSLVERMLELHKRNPNTPQEKEALQREIQSTDNQIDRLVYDLYGLTDDEIRIVEATQRHEA
jgi:hypothetical protein